MANPSPAPSSPARKRLLGAATFGVIGVSLAGGQAVAGIGLPCPWRALTHTLCPFCGSTSLGVALLHGDLAGAWAANPFVFVLLVGAGFASLAWIVELAGGPAIRLPRPLARQGLWYALLGTAALVFTVLRNLPPLA